MWRGAILSLLCALTFVTGLGRTAIEDSDEAYYAESAREMVLSGDWVTPHYNYEPRLQKPILFYWLIAATYSIAGVSETAARLWSALAGAGLAFVTFAAARRWVGDDVGFLAGVIVATSFGVVPLARESLPDTPLALFVTITIWAAIEALDASSGGGRSTRLSASAWLHIAAVACALGMLTKGPVAVALPVTVLAPLILWEWRAGRLATFPFTIVQLVGACLVFAFVAAPWYIAVTRARGLEYLPQFFVGENLDRFATAEYNRWRGYIYLPIIFAGLLPWSTFGLSWLQSARALLTRTRTVQPIEVRLVCWAFGPLLFFMASIGSQPRYILPCLAPLAILLARTICRKATECGQLRCWTFALQAVLGALLMVVAGAMLILAHVQLDVLTAETSRIGAWLIVGAGVAVALGSVLVSARRVPVVVALGAIVSILSFESLVLATGRPEPVERIADAVRANGPVDSVCACGAFARSLNFYTGVKTVGVGASAQEVVYLVDQPTRMLAAMDARLLAEVERQLERRLPRLAEVRYLNAGPSQPGALFAPDPEDIQTIYLVTNGR